MVTVTLNGKVGGTVTNSVFTGTIGNLFISSDAAAGTTGSIHIDNVLIGVVIAGKAKDPSPADTGTDVPRDVVLGWTAGVVCQHAQRVPGHQLRRCQHRHESPVSSRPDRHVVPTGHGSGIRQDLLLACGRGQRARRAPRSSKATSGASRSNPTTYPLTNVTATASSYDKTTTTPANTVNGSGLTGDLHGHVHRHHVDQQHDRPDACLDPVSVRQGLQALRAVGLEPQHGNGDDSRLRASRMSPSSTLSTGRPGRC